MDSETWLIIFFGLLVALLVGVTTVQIRHVRQQHRAYHAYQDALRALQAQPRSADLRHQALACGQVYAALVRHRYGKRSYDETAVLKDIMAATAGATSALAAPIEELRNQRGRSDEE